MLDKKKLAEALAVAPEILPYFSALLADIRVLGSWPEEIIELLRSVELPRRSTKVLDLGCGKGAVTLPIAEELRFRVRAVDLFPPFIEEARERAEKRGVAHLCRYEVGDIRDVLKEGGSYDVAICHQPFERATPTCLRTNPLPEFCLQARCGLFQGGFWGS